MRVCDRYRENFSRTGPVERATPQLLRSIPLFSELSPEIIDRLSRDAAVWTAPDKTLLLREGSPADTLFILLEGLVQVEARAGDRDATILVLRPTDCFFVASVLGGTASLVSARALHDVRVLTLGADDVRRLSAVDPLFAKALMSELTRICGKTMCELKNSRTRSAFERLVAWTLAMHEQSNGSTPEMPYEKSVLAARLGMAPETLSRNLARIAKLGVTIRGRSLKIKNAENLRKLVQADDADTMSVP
jgi:CRP/FNR family transcriptional activator FtrB